MELSIAERIKKLSPRGAAALSALAIFAAGGCGAPSDQEKRCHPWQVYAQGMWKPPGVAVRVGPDRSTPQVGSLGPNEKVQVDYWLHTGKIAYEENKPPYKSDVWLHLVEAGKPNEWVNFAAVREKAVPAESYDPTGLKQDVGEPVNPPPECQLPDVAPGKSPTLPVVKSE